MSPLGDVLVVTARKSFWASREAEAWPRRIYARVFYGYSTNLLNSLVVTLRALLALQLRPAKVVLLGSVERAVPWFIRARRLGLLRGARLVVTNQLRLSDEQLEQVDRVIVYTRSQAERLGEKAVFLLLPADGDFDAARRTASPGDYVFSGGGAGRDFASLLEAVRGTDVRLELVAFAPEQAADAPPNVDVEGPMPQQRFLERMAGALLVVVPVREPDSPHGQTTVAQALALGKPVVATRSAGVVDYVDDGVEGLLVDAGDVAGYRAAIVRLIDDAELRSGCAQRARRRADDQTYGAFAARLAALCAELLET